MTRRLENKTALVTGSTSNIGREIAMAFGGEGAHVIVSGRGDTRGQAVVARIRDAGGKADYVHADLDGAVDLARGHPAAGLGSGHRVPRRGVHARCPGERARSPGCDRRRGGLSRLRRGRLRPRRGPRHRRGPGERAHFRGRRRRPSLTDSPACPGCRRCAPGTSRASRVRGQSETVLSGQIRALPGKTSKPGCPSCSSATLRRRPRKLLIFPNGRWLSFADRSRQLRGTRRAWSRWSMA